jgi:hypothetical protein
VGVTTSAKNEPDPERGPELVPAWREPDYTSVNLSEPGATELMEVLAGSVGTRRYATLRAGDSRSELLQDDLAGSAIASPQFQKSLQRRGGVVLVVVVGVGEDGPALFEKAIHELRPPQ